MVEVLCIYDPTMSRSRLAENVKAGSSFLLRKGRGICFHRRSSGLKFSLFKNDLIIPSQERAELTEHLFLLVSLVWRDSQPVFIFSVSSHLTQLSTFSIHKTSSTTSTTIVHRKGWRNKDPLTTSLSWKTPEQHSVVESAVDMASVEQQEDLKHRFLQRDKQPAFKIRVNHLAVKV